MDISRPVSTSVASVSFSFLSTEDVRRISVKQIVNPVLLDNLNQPNIGGLYDPALGPSSNREVCATCRLDYFQCPGHFGHIELPAPVFHPLFMMTAYKLLRGTCLYCHHFKVSRTQVIKTIAKLQLLDHGLLGSAEALEDHLENDKKRLNNGNDKNEDDGEAEMEERVNLFVKLNLKSGKAVNRDEYRDGAIYQARKSAVDDFFKTALLSSKRCQRKQCGAIANSFRKEGHTKIVEYDLTPKQKIQMDHIGIRRPDVFAYDRAMHRETLGSTLSSAKVARLTAGSDSGMDVDDVMDDEDTETDEGPGEDTSELPTVARAVNGRVKTSRGRNERLVAPEEVRAHLRWLFRNESTLCSLIFGRRGPYARVNNGAISPAKADIFFLEVLVVSPTRFRPPAKMDDKLFEHPHNENLTRVLHTSYTLRDLTGELAVATSKGAANNVEERERILGKLLENLIVLQTQVNSFVDSSKNPVKPRQGKLPTPGIKQGLEKKEGLFRMHMMGKRVNYAARSVISPDINIETNEIGVPPVFARKLTFPEPVTQHNVTRLRELVIRGPKEHPGASMVQFEDGVTQSLEKLSLEQRTAIANQLLTPREIEKASSSLRTRLPIVGKKVYRHLQDGDILILNRQPTLHKPSMMAHKAKILPGEKTIRMHYANCNSYNADFDGDEMNIHFPQGQIARSEAIHIANTDNQYLVPTSGRPLRGLIQDHVVGGLWLTNKSTFFTRDEYHQLIYGALRPEDEYTGSGKVITLPPAILKPRPLWTGKQIISTILRNITPRNASALTMKSKAQVKEGSWSRPLEVDYPGISSDEKRRLGKGLSEEKVLVFEGELVRGVLDKSQFGAAPYGLVHSVYDVYGAEVAGKLLSILSRLFTKYLQHRAFTCRMDDLALTPHGDEARKREMQSRSKYGTDAAIGFFSDLAGDLTANENERQHRLNSLLEQVLRDDAQMAGLDNIVKGKMKELSEAVVQSVLPTGLLRPFPNNHMQAMTISGAKGSPTNARQISALLGQQELEGRRVPVMVSGKTLPSFKPFETAAIAGGYIGSRFLTGLKAQEFYFHCMAGREGLIDTAVKTSRSGYLQRCLIKHLEGIRVHYDHTVRGADSAVYQFLYGEDGLDVTRQMHLNEFAFNLKNHQSLASKFAARSLAGKIDESEASEHMKKLLKRKKKHPDRNLSDPTLFTFSPSRYLGSTSERFAEKVDEYISNNKNHLLVVKSQTNQRKTIKPVLSAKMFRSLMSVRYMRSLVEPGEAVGLLASQGVGEPSTQMTLNTFHFAGHGAANVTLGIPRLREIVMTAAIDPKTPMMQLPIRKGTTMAEIERFCQQTSRLTLSQLIDKIEVTERIQKPTSSLGKVFSVQLLFFPLQECFKTHYMGIEHFALALTRLAGILRREIALHFKRLEKDLKAQAANIGKGITIRDASAQDEQEQNEEVRDDELSERGDGDADDEKRLRRTQEQATYEEESGDEEEEKEDEDIDEDAIEAGTDAADSQAGDEIQQDDPHEAEITEIREAFAQALPLVPKSFSFDENGRIRFDLEYEIQIPKLLMVDILEKACTKCVVRDINGINKCHPPSRSRNMIVDDTIIAENAEIVVEGTNLRDIPYLAEDIVDITRIKTNNIHAMLTTYGVEAARATIIQEIANVFALYSINVNVRHLMLISDYMTFDGGFKPFNRRGIATHSSPLLKASYETTVAFLSDATLHGDFDNLTTPSGNIIVGRPALSGTGVFDVVLPVSETS